MHQVKRPLQHRRGRAHAVMPIHFTEHHVAGKDHHLGRGLPLLGDGQPVPRGVQAQAADEPPLVEITAIRHAGVQAVAKQVVHLVDVDRTGQQARQQPALGVPRLAREQGHDVAGLNRPVVAQRVGNLAFQKKTVGKQLVLGHASELHVFDRVAKRPMSQVVQQGRGNEQLRIAGRDDLGEPSVVGKLPQKQQRQPVHSQRMLEPRMVGRWIHQRHQPQLADPGQPPVLGRVDDRPHARRLAARRSRPVSAASPDGRPGPRLPAGRESRSSAAACVLRVRSL